MFAGRSTSFSTLSTSSLKSKSSSTTTTTASRKKSMSSSSFSVVTTTIIALLFFIVIDIEYVSCMSLDRFSIEKNELPTERTVKKDDIYVDDDRELEAVPELGSTELFVLVPGDSANERESVDKNTIETKERDEDAPSAIESEGDMLMMESNDAPPAIVMQQTIAAPESIDEDKVKVESVEYKEDEQQQQKEELQPSEKQQIVQLIAQAEKEDEYNLPPLALPLVGVNPKEEQKDYNVPPLALHLVDMDLKEIEKEVVPSPALVEVDDEEIPMIAEINATNEMSSAETAAVVPAKIEASEMVTSASAADSAREDSEQELENVSETETLADAIADVIEDVVEDDIESALSNDEDLSALTDAIIDEDLNKNEQENADKNLEDEKQEAIESLTAIEDMLSEESAPVESVVQKDESVEKQEETVEKSEEEDTNKIETEKEETEAVKEELQAVKDEIEVVKDGIETAKDELEVVKDENEAVKDETEAIKNETIEVEVETEAIKNETLEVKDETETIKNETIEVKDETEAIKDEALEVKDETVAVKDETVEVNDETAVVKDEIEAVKDETVAIKDQTEAIKDEAETVAKDEVVSEEINETEEQIKEETEESKEKVPTETVEQFKEEQPIVETDRETLTEENKIESVESVAQDQTVQEETETMNAILEEKPENLLQNDDLNAQHNAIIKEEQTIVEEVLKLEEQNEQQVNEEQPEELVQTQQHEEHHDITQIVEDEKKEIPVATPTLEEETEKPHQPIEEQKVDEKLTAPAAVQQEEQATVEIINSESVENKNEQELPVEKLEEPIITAELIPETIVEIAPQHANEIATEPMEEIQIVENVAPVNVEQVVAVENTQEKVEPNESINTILTTIIPQATQVEPQLQSIAAINVELSNPTAPQVENEKPPPTIVAPQVAPIEIISSSSTQKPLSVIDTVLSYVNASSVALPQIIKPNKKKQPQLPQLDEEIFNSQLRRYDGAQVWRIVVQNDRDKLMADQLQTKYDGQLWKEVKQEVDYLLKPQVLAEAAQHIRAANLSRIVLIDNLQNVIESENPTADEIAQLQNRKGHRLTWQAYHRLADIHGYFDYLAKTYPDICTVETIGYSLQKRPLKVLKISNGDAGNPSFWLDGGMHAREWISPATVTYIANQLVEGYDDLPAYMKGINWYIHAVANPDGYEYSHTTDRLWRKNMRSHGRQCPGVDLNRNFGYKWGGKGTSANPCAQTYRGSKAFSEPETFYISKFISNFPRDTFQAYMSFHSYGQYILYPWGYDYHLTADKSDLDRVARQAGTIITKSSGVKYTVGSSATTLYPAAGGSDDWAKGFAGIKYSYTIEMGDTGRYGFVLPASFIETNGKDGYTFVETVARAVKLGKESRKRTV